MAVERQNIVKLAVSTARYLVLKDSKDKIVDNLVKVFSLSEDHISANLQFKTKEFSYKASLYQDLFGYREFLTLELEQTGNGYTVYVKRFPIDIRSYELAEEVLKLIK